MIRSSKRLLAIFTAAAMMAALASTLIVRGDDPLDFLGSGNGTAVTSTLTGIDRKTVQITGHGQTEWNSETPASSKYNGAVYKYAQDIDGLQVSFKIPPGAANSAYILSFTNENYPMIYGQGANYSGGFYVLLYNINPGDDYSPIYALHVRDKDGNELINPVDRAIRIAPGDVNTLRFARQPDTTYNMYIDCPTWNDNNATRPGTSTATGLLLDRLVDGAVYPAIHFQPDASIAATDITYQFGVPSSVTGALTDFVSPGNGASVVTSASQTSALTAEVNGRGAAEWNGTPAASKYNGVVYQHPQDLNGLSVSFKIPSEPVGSHYVLSFSDGAYPIIHGMGAEYASGFYIVIALDTGDAYSRYYNTYVYDLAGGVLASGTLRIMPDDVNTLTFKKQANGKYSLTFVCPTHDSTNIAYAGAINNAAGLDLAPLISGKVYPGMYAHAAQTVGFTFGVPSAGTYKAVLTEDEQRMYQNSILNEGDSSRIEQVMQRALAGEEITIGAIGGSITQGASATSAAKEYSYLVYDWWVKKFSKASVSFRKAGIGSTTSMLGVHRADTQLMAAEPDFVIVDFSCNDSNLPAHQESYEGILRKVLESPGQPGVLMVAFTYQDWTNVQALHLELAEHYDIPMLSMREALKPEVDAQRMSWSDYSDDIVHPNDAGHRLAAALYIEKLEQIYASLSEEQVQIPATPAPLTPNRYQDAVMYNNRQIRPVANQDWSTVEDIYWALQNGWSAHKKDATISFIVNAKTIHLLFTMNGESDAGRAEVKVDGVVAATIDTAFTGNWNYLAERALVVGDTAAEHLIEIRNLDEGKRFDLVAVMASGVAEEPDSPEQGITPAKAQAAINATAGLDEADYTQATWQAFAQARTNLQNAIDGGASNLQALYDAFRLAYQRLAVAGGEWESIDEDKLVGGWYPSQKGGWISTEYSPLTATATGYNGVIFTGKGDTDYLSAIPKMQLPNSVGGVYSRMQKLDDLSLGFTVRSSLPKTNAILLSFSTTPTGLYHTNPDGSDANGFYITMQQNNDEYSSFLDTTVFGKNAVEIGRPAYSIRYNRNDETTIQFKRLPNGKYEIHISNASWMIDNSSREPHIRKQIIGPIDLSPYLNEDREVYVSAKYFCINTETAEQEVSYSVTVKSDELTAELAQEAIDVTSGYHASDYTASSWSAFAAARTALQAAIDQNSPDLAAAFAAFGTALRGLRAVTSDFEGIDTSKLVNGWYPSQKGGWAGSDYSPLQSDAVRFNGIRLTGKGTTDYESAIAAKKLPNAVGAIYSTPLTLDGLSLDLSINSSIPKNNVILLSFSTTPTGLMHMTGDGSDSEGFYITLQESGDEYSSFLGVLAFGKNATALSAPVYGVRYALDEATHLKFVQRNDGKYELHVWNSAWMKDDDSRPEHLKKQVIGPIDLSGILNSDDRLYVGARYFTLDESTANKVISYTVELLSLPVTKAEAQAKLDELANLDSEDYTENSWKAYSDARAVLQDAIDGDLSDLQKKYDAFLEAYDSLALKFDDLMSLDALRALVKSLLEKDSMLKEKDYSAASWSAYAKARADLQSSYDENAGVFELTGRYERYLEAKAALTAAGADGGGTGSGSNSATGDDMKLWLWALLFGGAGALGLITFRRRRGSRIEG